MINRSKDLNTHLFFVKSISFYGIEIDCFSNDKKSHASCEERIAKRLNGAHTQPFSRKICFLNMLKRHNCAKYFHKPKKLTWCFCLFNCIVHKSAMLHCKT